MGHSSMWHWLVRHVGALDRLRSPDARAFKGRTKIGEWSMSTPLPEALSLGFDTEGINAGGITLRPEPLSTTNPQLVGQNWLSIPLLRTKLSQKT